MYHLKHEDYIASLDQDNALAYKANYEVFKGGKTKHEVAQYYDQWAEQGDYDLVNILYIFVIIKIVLIFSTFNTTAADVIGNTQALSCKIFIYKYRLI